MPMGKPDICHEPVGHDHDATGGDLREEVLGMSRRYRRELIELPKRPHAQCGCQLAIDEDTEVVRILAPIKALLEAAESRPATGWVHRVMAQPKDRFEFDFGFGAPVA